MIEAKVVGDMIMGLAETCRAAGKNISEYLLTAHRNKKQVHKNPEAWYPGSPAIFFMGKLVEAPRHFGFEWLRGRSRQGRELSF